MDKWTYEQTEPNSEDTSASTGAQKLTFWKHCRNYYYKTWGNILEGKIKSYVQNKTAISFVTSMIADEQNSLNNTKSAVSPTCSPNYSWEQCRNCGHCRIDLNNSINTYPRDLKHGSINSGWCNTQFLKKWAPNSLGFLRYRKSG